MMKRILDFPKNIAIGLIVIYQKLLSPDHSWIKGRFPYGYCRHYPTCSEYAKQAIEKFGFIKGGWLGMKRIVKCNPWAEPKVDNIPQGAN